MNNSFNFNLLKSEVERLSGGQLSRIRNNALNNLKNAEFPNKNHEDWKYTDISDALKLIEKSLRTNQKSKLCPDKNNYQIMNQIDAHWIILNNEIFTKKKPTQPKKGEIMVSFASSNKDEAEILIDDPLSCLNAALIKDAIKITIRDNTELEKPIGIIWDGFLGQNIHFSNFRCIIEIKENASVDFIHMHQSKVNEPHFTNSVVQLDMARNSKVNYLKIQNYPKRHTVIEKSVTNLDDNAYINYTNIDLGGELSRSNIIINLNGEQSTANVNGIYLASTKQHIDNHITANHANQSTKSSQDFYGIIGRKGHCVFNGKALINEGAIKSEANQYNHNILLTDNAVIDTKPELEIYTDDVKCSHGSTVGQLDKDALFYMQSRGINPDTAKKMLTTAFITKILDKIDIQSSSNYLNSVISKKLDNLSL
ncbi:MAG: Fe-S cluster assembly protein SufD [Pseudomonadota bacterium]|nr:Fe-S cluster assembly protein SufD [Pseudomonadota bacterium]